MNKAELVKAISEKAALNKTDSKKALNAFIDVASETLIRGEKVQLSGFGTFEVCNRRTREGRNPWTGEPLTIAAKKAPKFKASKKLKEQIKISR